MPLTVRLNKILIYARDEAERLNNAEVQPEHLLLGILRLAEGQAFELLTSAGVPAKQVKQDLDSAMTGNNSTITESITRSELVNRILRIADGICHEYGEEATGSIHLLLAVLRERINRVSVYLESTWGLTYERALELYAKPHPTIQEPMAGMGQGNDVADAPHPQSSQRNTTKLGATTALDKYGRDLTKLAERGELDPVIGREEEIERVTQILSRRKKNNPVLIGDPGVGKSAIVEGIARRIVRNEAGVLNGKRIITLDVSSIVAGTTYRGQFEERMKSVLQELQKHPEVILFIDEIHTIIGAGNAQGSLDAANILKPALARGEVQCIGATTTAEYRKSIEKDGALERRFQKVNVRPTTKEETISILNSLSNYYGEYHHVHYSDEIICTIVDFAERYLNDRAFPDKAIDVLDEVGARVHTRMLGDGKEEQPTIKESEVAEVVSLMSGIPVQRVKAAENKQLRTMGDELKKRVIGQNEAVQAVVRAIQRSRLGLRDPKRPIGTFFFLGPTGVGKTYLAQCLAEEMFGSKDAIIRFDMSEYMEKHTVSLLVGAPPGYIAHEDGGKLTEAVRRKPYSIILFDEIEKAHPDIYNILLQVLDEGRLTDRQGNSVDFRNTIIILTSNVGTRQLKEFGAGIGFGVQELDEKSVNKTLIKALQKTFPPEFVNRIDNVITFQPLSRAALAQIVNIEVAILQKRLRQNGHELVISTTAKEQLLDRSYDPQNGARPLKRAIQNYLEDPITDVLLVHPRQKRISIKQIK